MKLLIVKLPLFMAVLLVLQTLLSLDWQTGSDTEVWAGWQAGIGKLVRIKIADPDHCEAVGEIADIQKQVKAHSTLGFLWKEQIDTSHEVLIQWGDTPPSALTTDRFGFINSPEAIESLKKGRPVDIIGVGASYMGGAQGLFHEYFGFRDIFYYNMANARFTTPQYNVALKEFALPLKPKWILYGLNEVSYLLTDDYEQWRSSGMDWFTFHSGFWCGPALKTGFPHDQLRRFCRPLHGVYTALIRSLFRPSLELGQKERKRLVDKTYRYIIEAQASAREQGAGFILLCIPSKSRMVGGPSPKNFLFEMLLPKLAEKGITIVDLRDNFSAVGDPHSLYYTIDDHWNRQGIYLTARALLDVLENSRTYQAGVHVSGTVAQ